MLLTTDGRVWSTRNGGRKWIELAGTGTNAATDMAFGDARHGYLTIPEWAEAGDLRGTVLVANSLGSGVLESGALLGFLPGIANHLFGEELLLPSVGTSMRAVSS